MRRHPAIPYVLPFAVFIGMLALQQLVPTPEWVKHLPESLIAVFSAFQRLLPIPAWVRFAVSIVAIIAVSMAPLRAGPSKPLTSILIGVAVFVVWVAPDVIAPWWRHIFLFDNSITGHPAGNTPPASQHDPVFLIFRIAISVIAVPILEELFWRGWLMRWLVDSRDFERVPLGTFAPAAFWITALLFASEHGSFWDVGLAAGIIYNWWMIRTRNLWDCILAHAVTNGILAAYVIGAGQWQYWL